jgi:hypothetical protein
LRAASAHEMAHPKRPPSSPGQPTALTIQGAAPTSQLIGGPEVAHPGSAQPSVCWWATRTRGASPRTSTASSSRTSDAPERLPGVMYRIVTWRPSTAARKTRVSPLTNNPQRGASPSRYKMLPDGMSRRMAPLNKRSSTSSGRLASTLRRRAGSYQSGCRAAMLCDGKYAAYPCLPRHGELRRLAPTSPQPTSDRPMRGCSLTTSQARSNGSKHVVLTTDWARALAIHVRHVPVQRLHSRCDCTLRGCQARVPRCRRLWRRPDRVAADAARRGRRPSALAGGSIATGSRYRCRS